jgi:hypothetical protein
MQMEFSFGTKRWMKREWKAEKEEVAIGEELETDGYSLGLHAPGFFDKVLHVETCLLHSEPADKVMNWFMMMYWSCFLKMEYWIQCVSDMVLKF